MTSQLTSMEVSYLAWARWQKPM